MENFILNINQEVTNFELLSYLSSNIFLIFAIVLNLILYLFFKRKIDIKRKSDFITIISSVLSALSLGGIYFKNLFLFPDFNFTIFNNLLSFNLEIVFVQFLICLFFIFFFLTNYKLIRKARFKAPLINSIALFIMIVSIFLVQIQNDILAYLLLDIIVISIYKYASNMRIRKENFYSPDFILKTLCADILFFGFYITTLFLKDILQLDIVGTCLSCAFFLKIGLFPVFNYSQTPRYKTNIPYSILVFCFLPLIGFIAFEKTILNFNFTNEIYQLTIAIFLTLTILSCALKAFKTKNLIRFFANISYCYTSFYILAMLFNCNYKLCLNMMLLSTFLMVGLYSLIGILKINLKCSKINFLTCRAVFFNNRFFAFLLSFSLLLETNVFISALLKNNLEILKQIYIFDKSAVIFIFVLVTANILIILNSLKLIQNCYTVKKPFPIAFNKKTALNYAVCLLIILFLAVISFLQIFNIFKNS